MQLGREAILDASLEEVWTVLWNVPRIAACVPGCVEAREIEPGRRWETRMSQRVGPIVLTLPLLVEASEIEPPRRLALQASGHDPLVGTTISMRVALALEPAEAGTRLRIDADARLLGKLGALGHGVVQRKAEEALDEFVARLRRAVKG